MKQIFLGFASGIMLSASIFSLIMPSFDYEDEVSIPILLVIVIGFVLGCLFLWAIDKIVPHIHKDLNEEEGIKTNKISKTGKMFLAVTIHNIPEGLSVGIAFGAALASQNHTLVMSALMLAIGIGIQNFPEGAAVSLPIKEEKGSLKAFLYGVASGAVEPIAAIIGLFLSYYLRGIMPYALSFAAGAMIYVTVEELIPESQLDSKAHYGTFAFIVGFLLMMILDVVLSF